MTHLNIQQGLNIEVVSTSIIKKLYDAAQSVPLPEEGEQDLANMSGNLQVDKSYRSLVEYLTTRFPDLYINVTTDYYVEFEDPVAKNYCALLYGDGIGVTTSALAGVVNYNNLWTDNRGSVSMPADLKSLVTTLNDFQYFTGIGSDEHSNLVNGFTNATSIKFPSCTFVYSNIYTLSIVSYCENLQTIDYSNVIFVSTRGTIFPILGNNVILDWDSSLIPNQTSLKGVLLFHSWSKLQKIIFPEGITETFESFRSMLSIQYAEFPSTITSLGSGWDLGRNSGHRLPCMVVKAVTPPAWTEWNPNDTSGSGGGLGWTLLPVAIYVPDNSVTAYKSVANGGTTNESLWANPDIQALIKPMSEIPLIYRDMGTVTQADIDRI